MESNRIYHQSSLSMIDMIIDNKARRAHRAMKAHKLGGGGAIFYEHIYIALRAPMGFRINF